MINFSRYYIWGPPEHQISLILTEVPKKAVIFAPEEFELMLGWGESKLLDSVELTVILGSASNEYVQNSKSIPKTATTIHWSTYWINATYREFIHDLDYKLNKIDKLYISLNNKAHDHRCQMIDELCHNDLMTHGYVSWHEPNKVYDWKYWKPELLLLDPEYHEKYHSYDLPAEFGSTLINIIAETTMHTVFITEKTCTALLFNKPFIVFGAKGFHGELKKLGFELYDELFDYSFDTHEDQTVRLQGIMDNLNNLKNQNYEILRNTIMDKAERNRKHMIHIATSRNYIPEFVLNYISFLKTHHDVAIARDHSYLALESLLLD